MAYTNISSDTSAATYAILNARDIKEYIVDQLKNSDNPVFKDVEYVGSNMNAFIDTLAVMFQQLLFHFSLAASETTFSSAQLYESMNKLVSILNYKTMGKQTSMLPVRLTVNNVKSLIDGNIDKIVIPRFLTIEHNNHYILKNEIVQDVDKLTNTLYINTLLFQGTLQNTSEMTALGDEYETFILKDEFTKYGDRFISDNFFIVFVLNSETGKYRMFTETNNLFMENGRALVYEKRFNDQQNYEFKFGNGVYGSKLKKDDKVVIFYLVSNGENGILSDGIIKNTQPSLNSSAAYDNIVANMEETQQQGVAITEEFLDNVSIS